SGNAENSSNRELKSLLTMVLFLSHHEDKNKITSNQIFGVKLYIITFGFFISFVPGRTDVRSGQ
ncbi:MAG TPA: hypothetical protein H9828_04080, partial [Candidatus Alistipes intestinigallinarum]|nr:hypothetical protein [Candidatus Alistipes intestinigallinarum]